jgi:hypothetical protein
MAGELVGAFGAYMGDSPNMPYHIRLNGRFFCSHDTYYLANKVCDAFSKAELTKLVESIPTPAIDTLPDPDRYIYDPEDDADE